MDSHSCVISLEHVSALLYVSFYLCLLKKFIALIGHALSWSVAFRLFTVLVLAIHWMAAKLIWLVKPECKSGINGDLVNKKLLFTFLCDF